MSNEDCNKEQYNNTCKHRFNNIDERFTNIDGHFNNVDKKFDDLGNYIQEMADDRKEDIREIKGVIKDVSKVVDRIDKTVNIGNGNPSIVTQVALLTQDHNRTQWWKRTAIVTIVGLVGFAAEETIRHSIHTRDAQETVVEQRQILIEQLSQIKGEPVSLSVPASRPVTSIIPLSVTVKKDEK